MDTTNRDMGTSEYSTISYSYERQKKKLFTEEGVDLLLKVRAKVDELLEASGTLKASKVFCSDDTNARWTALAALDYMVERGEIEEIGGPERWEMSRVFAKKVGVV